MPFLAQIIIAVVSFALSYILRPKPSSADKTTDQGDVEFPSVSEGVEIPVFFGIIWSSDTTVVWWGDLEVTEHDFNV